jgi:hypothetical protein
MEYYSRRNKPEPISIGELHMRVSALIDEFINNDFFKEKLGITETTSNFDSINRKSVTQIGFQVFPIKSWLISQIEKNRIFDTLEFLYQFVSEPSNWEPMVDETNYHYYDYSTYNSRKGKKLFIEEVNHIISAFEDGFELTKDGEILFKGDDSQNFIETEYQSYKIEDVDPLIKKAIKQWKNRNQSLDEKKQAIINLANVFEFLKKEGTLEEVLNSKDTRDLFNIANNFSIRHYNKLQKTDYDTEIWYDWIIQFYLATCTTTLKLINKNKP